MTALGEAQERYRQEMLDLREAIREKREGSPALQKRSAAVDRLLGSLWQETLRQKPKLEIGVALVAVGGYGREQLFPFSDVDLLFLLDSRQDEAGLRDALRSFSQAVWDAGARFSPMTRRVSECERFDPENVEFALALLDFRAVCGDGAVVERLRERAMPRLLGDGSAIGRRLLEVTTQRRAKYGDTLFHLEPNVKDAPGGLRDAHVGAWCAALSGARAASAKERDRPHLKTSGAGADGREFHDAVLFMTELRCFLHVQHERDDNVLDWHAQDLAARRAIGLAEIAAGGPGPDPAYWMRLYFRHARVIGGRAQQRLAELEAWTARSGRRGGRAATPPISPAAERLGIGASGARLSLPSGQGQEADPAGNPHLVLTLFAEVARTGLALDLGTEHRLAAALAQISVDLDEGAALWQGLRSILLGRYAGRALRSMHALGLLDLLVPEFHGIDALVLRDAYHRYTVDEHTFVLIDTLHGLGRGVTDRQRRVAGALRAAAARSAAPGAAVFGGAAARYGKGAQHRRPYSRERQVDWGAAGAPGARRV